MPDSPRPASTGKLTVTAAWVDGNIGCAITLASTLGLACVVGVMSIYHRWCGPNDPGLCLLAKQSPPWVLLAGLAAAPAVLLTWYWRTTQRKRELDLKQRELDQKDNDHRIAVDSREQQNAAAVDSELTTFERTMITSNLESCRLLVRQTRQLVLRVGSPEVKARVAVGVETGLRYQENIERSKHDAGVHRQLVEEALHLLSDAQKSLDSPVPVNLRGVRMQLVNLDGLSLRNVDFRGAILYRVSLEGADLSGSRFEDCKGHYVRYDETTIVDDEQRAWLASLTKPAPVAMLIDGDESSTSNEDPKLE